MNLYQSTFFLYFIFIKFGLILSGAIQITTTNIDSILYSNEIVFINFYTNWCRFSKILSPIYDQLADKIIKEFTKKNLIIIGKVDSDIDSSIAIKYHINKYPTFKLFRNGLLIKKEYRGSRDVNSLFDYLKKQIESPIIKFLTLNQLDNLDKTNVYIIGYFNNENSLNYNIFSKIANLLRDQCHFIVFINQNENEKIYSLLNDETEIFNLSLINENIFYMWSNNKCNRLIREITFENAEELTDEGLPLLILFHHINDNISIQLFQQQIKKQLIHQISNINCLHGDGTKFIHPLKHLGKTIDDLPLLIIDSFQHMFIFQDFKQITIDGKLLEFVNDFQSGKLHEEYHKINSDNENIKSKNKISFPPQSVFVRLTPSRQRYSFKDEL